MPVQTAILCTQLLCASCEEEHKQRTASRLIALVVLKDHKPARTSSGPGKLDSGCKRRLYAAYRHNAVASAPSSSPSIYVAVAGGSVITAFAVCHDMDSSHSLLHLAPSVLRTPALSRQAHCL